VKWTDAAGALHDGGNGQGESPIEYAGYDQSGRLVTSTDANGYVTRRTLLAGTGYGGAQAMVTREWRPDNGSTRMDYDQFGDLRTSSLLVGTAANGSEVRRDTTSVYDKLGRLTQTTNARGLTDYYDYDQLGQRIRHTNSLLGTTDAETTRYDIQGRVVLTRAFGGDETATSYSWSDTVPATGLGLATGGIVRTTTYANTRTSAETTDGFGHVVSSTNMGGAVTTTAYDKGGRITGRETTLNGTVTDTLAYAYLNTGLARTATRTGGGTVAKADTASTAGLAAAIEAVYLRGRACRYAGSVSRPHIRSDRYSAQTQL
jgi:YD repeat-containing protein